MTINRGAGDIVSLRSSDVGVVRNTGSKGETHP